MGEFYVTDVPWAFPVCWRCGATRLVAMIDYRGACTSCFWDDGLRYFERSETFPAGADLAKIRAAARSPTEIAEAAKRRRDKRKQYQKDREKRDREAKRAAKDGNNE